MATLEESQTTTGTGSQRPVRVAATLFAICLACWLLRVARPFFITLISAILLAFILEPAVQLFMRFRLRRGMASFLACSVMLGTLYLTLLGAWTQAVGLMADVPNYSKRITELVDTASLEVEQLQRTVEETLVPPRLRQIAPLESPTKSKSPSRNKKAAAAAGANQPNAVQEVRIRQEPGDLVNLVWDSLSKFSDALLMASFVPFLVYFFLSWQDHVMRSLLGLAGGRQREILNRSLQGIADVTRAYVVGNFLLGVVMAVVSSLFFYFAGVPYWEVAGPISAFLSLIPYLGLPLALLPPLAAALPVFASWGTLPGCERGRRGPAPGVLESDVPQARRFARSSQPAGGDPGPDGLVYPVGRRRTRTRHSHHGRHEGGLRQRAGLAWLRQAARRLAIRSARLG